MRRFANCRAVCWVWKIGDPRLILVTLTTSFGRTGIVHCLLDCKIVSPDQSKQRSESVWLGLTVMVLQIELIENPRVKIEVVATRD